MTPESPNGLPRYEFQNKELFRAVCGINDRGIAVLSERLGFSLIARGNALLFQTEDPELIVFARSFLTGLEASYQKRVPTADDLMLFYRMSGASAMEVLREDFFKAYNGRLIRPRTPGQALFLEQLMKGEATICEGPAGTGKTFLCVVAACKLMQQGQIERIILCRPAVEAGENLGFLPGDLIQKVDPYLRPLYDALYECLGFERVNDLIARHQIEVVPLAFMRGRTLNQAMIILDEAQNCTLLQLKMFLTRPGEGARLCINGDSTQVDIQRGRSGLGRVIELLSSLPEVHIMRLGLEDIVRNPLVEKIVRAFEGVE
ncbi:MAG: PhoH family protein [Spirochaetales bacterium]|nr:PhoH family protein [Spirochaetales bacterium]